MATTTWNPADKAAGITLYGGNLSAYSSGSAGIVRATVARNSGKYYFEVSIFDGGYSELSFIGITTAVQSVSTYLNASGAPSFSAKASGNKYAGSVASYLNCFFALPPAIIGVAIDFDAHKIWWHQDGDWFGGNPALGTGAHFSTLVANTDYYPAFTPLNLYGAGRFSLASFGYTPPVGPFADSRACRGRGSETDRDCHIMADHRGYQRRAYYEGGCVGKPLFSPPVGHRVPWGAVQTYTANQPLRKQQYMVSGRAAARVCIYRQRTECRNCIGGYGRNHRAFWGGDGPCLRRTESFPYFVWGYRCDSGGGGVALACGLGLWAGECRVNGGGQFTG